MTVSAAPGQDWRATLRRQKARAVNGQPDGGYTSTFEIVCRDCGDDPGVGLPGRPAPPAAHPRPVPDRDRRHAYQAHLAWYEELTSAR